MCDLKPGDEVVCFRHLDDAGVLEGMPPIGHIDTVRAVGKSTDGPEWGVLLEGHKAPSDYAMNVLCFRKVERRDWSALLAGATTIEGPVRAPAEEKAA